MAHIYSREPRFVDDRLSQGDLPPEFSPSDSQVDREEIDEEEEPFHGRAKDSMKLSNGRKHPVRTAAGLLSQYNLSGRLTGPDVELAPIPGQELI